MILQLLKNFLAVVAAMSIVYAIQVKAITPVSPHTCTANCGYGECLVAEVNQNKAECVCDDCYTPSSHCNDLDSNSDCWISQKGQNERDVWVEHYTDKKGATNELNSLVVKCGVVPGRTCDFRYTFKDGMHKKFYRCESGGILAEVGSGAATSEDTCAYKFDDDPLKNCVTGRGTGDIYCNFPNGNCVISTAVCGGSDWNRCVCKACYMGQYCEIARGMNCNVTELLTDPAATVHTSHGAPTSKQLTISHDVVACDKSVRKVCKSGYAFPDRSGKTKTYRCDYTAGALLNRAGTGTFNAQTDTCVKACEPGVAECKNGGVCGKGGMCDCDATKCYTGIMCNQIKMCPAPPNAVVVGDPSCDGFGGVVACMSDHKFSGSGSATVTAHMSDCGPGGVWTLRADGTALPACLTCDPITDICVFSPSGLMELLVDAPGPGGTIGGTSQFQT